MHSWSDCCPAKSSKIDTDPLPQVWNVFSIDRFSDALCQTHVATGTGCSEKQGKELGQHLQFPMISSNHE